MNQNTKCNHNGQKQNVKSSRFIILMAVAGSLWFQYFFYFPWVGQLQNQENAEGTILRSSSSNKDDKPAANTGSVFSGNVVRTFATPKRLQDKALPMEPQYSIPLYQKSNLCEKWGVVTTINAPTVSILTFAALKDWCLVIVADTKTPTEGYLQLTNKHPGRIVFLSLQDQSDMAVKSSFVKMIPYKSFARKNIGYLFAIRHGAQAIFDFDDDNVLKETAFSSTPMTPLEMLHEKDDRNNINKPLWIVRAPSYTINKTTALSFNPLPFMKPSVAEIWPRGFPLQDIKPASVTTSTTDISQKTTLQSIPRAKIAVVQATCDEDPDVDAIYRLTHPLPVSFDEAPATAMRLLVPPGRYSPYNAQATTHMYDAFWGLLLPYTVLGRVTDIWRSYFTQRILHDLGLVVVYSPPIVVHSGSVHNYIADLQAEQDLYMKTGALLDFLSTWKDTSPKLPARMENMAIALYERDYIDLDDVLAMQEWLLALIDSGYKFPSLSEVQELSHVMKELPVLHEQAFVVPPVYNFGGKEGDWTLYSNFVESKESSATVEDWNEWLEGSKIFQEQHPGLVPRGIVMSLVIMAKDEWPILRNNILYHGHLLGFENLYVLDGSTDPRCTSFLIFARDQLGVNVIFTPANLNELEDEMSTIGVHIAGSTDLIAKIDVDEFVAVDTNDGTCSHDNSVGRSPRSCVTSPLAMKTFLQNRTNLEVFFSGVGQLFFGSVSGSVADQELCRLGRGDEVSSYMYNHYSQPEGFKMIVDARTLAFIELGGHENGLLAPHETSNDTYFTPVGILHVHSRCFQHEVENCRKAVVSHGYLKESDTPLKLMKRLNVLMGEGGCAVDSTTKMAYPEAPSAHKVFFYARYLQKCQGATEADFYPTSYGSAASNPDFKLFMDEALSLRH